MIDVRWMTLRDMPEVVVIEKASYDDPWTPTEFSKMLSQQGRYPVIGMVADDGFGVVGFAVYEVSSRKIHLLNITVHPGYRRRGVGRAMIEKMKAKLSPGTRHRIVLEILEHNLPGQLFFKEMGFLAAKVLRGWLDGPDGKADAYGMVYRVCNQSRAMRESSR